MERLYRPEIVPKEDFDFEQDNHEFNWADKILKVETIKITHKNSMTWFKFENFFEDWKLLNYVMFGNSKTLSCPYSSVFNEEIDKDGVDYMDEFLKPAFLGWTVEEYYLNNKYNRSRYWGGGRIEWIWSDEEEGCLFKLFNLTRIMDLLFYLGIIGKVKRIEIEPIKSS